MLESWLPQGGTNLFQEIKQACKEAEARGQKLYRLSIGQPQGPALLSARKAAAEAVMSEEESMHEYQDNGSPGVPDFAKEFASAHGTWFFPSLARDIDFLPIPGIKPMLGLIPLACGVHTNNILAGTMTEPGYPTPAVWLDYLWAEHYALPLNPENRFRFETTDIRKNTNLLMLNYPHNPSGQVAPIKWWEEVCQYCAEKKIRLFNDAAYAILAHDDTNWQLAEVASRCQDLSWAEAFSASKVIANGTGWRVGAIVGSSDFIADIKTIKGNTDSGFVAPMAAGVLHALKRDRESVEANRRMYANRLVSLISILERNGMQLAVSPLAGFFSLWKLPKMAFGQKIKDARHFNFLMIERTGVVGVHFHPYIRYAVCNDVKAMAPAIEEAFKQAQVSY